MVLLKRLICWIRFPVPNVNCEEQSSNCCGSDDVAWILKRPLLDWQSYTYKRWDKYQMEIACASIKSMFEMWWFDLKFTHHCWCSNNADNKWIPDLTPHPIQPANTDSLEGDLAWWLDLGIHLVPTDRPSRWSPWCQYLIMLVINITVRMSKVQGMIKWW